MKYFIITLIFSLMSAFPLISQHYLPIDREGVKWVNEKVIVDHGDTTCYYYNYEIKGEYLETDLMEPRLFHPCYYYTGDELDSENDSVIASFDDRGGTVHCFKNIPYYKNLEDGRSLVHLWMYADGGTITLYLFYSAGSVYSWYGMNGYFMACQLEPFLTEDNFTEVSPIEIEGEQAKRWAYVGEQGDTLAVIVQGIGFDSRDMGDLLTPFTRKPDPDADYQEWCGLSHVVKDGKIIYKGMRYRNENLTGIDEVVAEQPLRPLDDNYYNLMGQPVGKDVPTAPGIYIHHGQKICVSRTR